MSVGLLILGLILFIGLVVVHELGHFIAARRGGVEVEEFGIGFPPRIYGRRFESDRSIWSVIAMSLKNVIPFSLGANPKPAEHASNNRGKTLYTINALPLGGFVRLKGEHDSARAPGSFGAAPLRTKVTIMLAGVFMNLVAAFVLLTILALIGMPRIIDNQFEVPSDTVVTRNLVRTPGTIGYVEEDSPAVNAGLKTMDEIVFMRPADCQACPEITISKTEVSSIRSVTEQFAGQKVIVGYERGGRQGTAEVQLRSHDEVEASLNAENPKGYLGVTPAAYELQRATWSAPIMAAGVMKQFTELNLKALGNALAGLLQGDTDKATKEVAGPLGVFVVLKDVSIAGIRFVLMIIAVISLTLAVMNVLPIPALDGGRLFVTLLYRILGRPLTKHAETLIHGTGFAVLMVLFVLITIVDVGRFF